MLSTHYLVFELDTVRYDPELYFFDWNRHNNLEGYEKGNEKHKFIWQPSGSQFTIIEGIPDDKWYIRIKRPELVDKETILKAVNFDESWYDVVK